MYIKTVDILTKYLTRLEDDTKEKIESLKKVTIIGVGGVGTWVGIMLSLVMLPGSKIILVDPDVLEENNMNRLPYPLSWFTSRKADALARYIAIIRPQITVEPIKKKFEELDNTEKMKILSSDVVIEAVDHPDTELKVYSFLKDRKPCIAGHYDGHHITIKYHPKCVMQDWTVDMNAGYRIVPSYPTIAILTASIVTELAIARPSEPVSISISL